MPWTLPDDDAERLALAKSYPFPAPKTSYLFRDGETAPLQGADYDGRTPVLAHGSNRAPAQLRRKFAGLSGADALVPVTYGWLAGYDVVYSAHVTRYGSVASTLRAAPGCRVRVAVTWLTPLQLVRMHASEGANYRYGRLAEAEIALEAGPAARLDELRLYLSDHGCLADAGAPIALAEVEAEGRPHRALAQSAVLALVRDRSEPEVALDAHILANIADAERRRRLIADLRRAALPDLVPDFQPVGATEEYL